MLYHRSWLFKCFPKHGKNKKDHLKKRSKILKQQNKSIQKEDENAWLKEIDRELVTEEVIQTEENTQVF